MALESLGQRRERAAIGPILGFVKRSPEWYEQMYAYQALKALGWNQATSR
jgi:HEAT repeat protein